MFGIQFADIKLPEKASSSGHVYYTDAQYVPANESEGSAFKVIYKENKHGDSHLSSLEVAFGQLAGLLLEHKPIQKLVMNHDNQVVGIAIEHLCYTIKKKEKENSSFFKLKNFEKVPTPEPEKIPVYFFDQLPHESFAHLVQLQQQGKLNIDYPSLANIFTSSYTLEEEDLHKGNFGFYLIEGEQGLPKAIFFKIDHDLMFVDSIMSFFSSRITRWDRGIEAYNITAEDLIHFPHIQNSDNFYWPTKKSLFPLLLGNKKYITDREIRSFRDLAKNSKFNKAKWTNFYKHILINEGLVKDSLKKCFDDTISRDRAQISLVTQALIARQARLRAVLFSVQEFREFVCEMSDDDKRALIHDIGASSPQDFESKMQLYQTFCTSPQGYEEGDTPLHIAIKLGDYRYEETMDIFEEFLHSKNKAGKSPFDVAYALAETQKQGTRPTDIRQDAQWTMKHLLERGAKITRQIDKEKILSYKFKTNYINRAEDAQHYAELKDTLRDIGEDHSFCLKFKKNLAIECIEGFIKKNQDNPNLKKILIRLREDVNGTSSDSESAGLQFIRQLRSKLWIIRQIRKLFGVSSTLAEIRSIINTELNQINAKDPHCFSFFSCCNSSKLDGDAEPGLGQDDPTHAPT